MTRRIFTRREVIKRAFVSSAGTMLAGGLFTSCPTKCSPTRELPPESCEPSYDDSHLGWGPSVLNPVFYGFADYDATGGAPSNLRVYYPSLDGAPHCGPFLAGPGHFPLVLFLHGVCPESFHYTKWSRLPAVLARSGFVVAIPDLSRIAGDSPWDLNNGTYSLIGDVLEWMRSSWSRSSFLMSPPTLGIVGHSWGALHGARVAVTLSATAFVSLGGGWLEWSPIASWPLHSLRAPNLLVWGTADTNASIPVSNWNSFPMPRHRLVFADGEHWDFLSRDASSCHTTVGPCDLVDELTADLTAVYLSKYMPPEMAGILPGFIPDNLVPPAVGLTPEQQFFAGNHLTSLDTFGNQAGCGATLNWATPDGSGTRAISSA